MDRLIAALRWLTKPATTLPEPQRRQAHLLAWLLLSMLLVTSAAFALVLIANPHNDPRRNEYLALVIGLIVLIGLAYGLNRAGHYYWSAGVTVACAVIAPWGSLILDPSILQGDIVPLAYVTVSVLLSSLLLPPSITSLLAVLQLLALGLFPLFSPANASINWPSFLILIFLISVLSILANMVRQRDLEQIDRQTRQLVLSEAHLREQSVHDPLTNLFNRRYLENTLEREIQRTARKGYPLGIIMLDIDHFKRFNDMLGHAAGDSVLQAFGQLLTQHIRQSDIACRYGGEEFVLIMPEATLDVTQKRAEYLRNEVEHLHVEHKNQTLETVTISLGVAVFPNHGSTGEAVLKSADAALYRAKGEGRNRVVVAD